MHSVSALSVLKTYILSLLNMWQSFATPCYHGFYCMTQNTSDQSLRPIYCDTLCLSGDFIHGLPQNQPYDQSSIEAVKLERTALHEVE